MPLPEASKKSPRVYTLLQNQNLENLTYDTIRDVGNTIKIEDMNEDELRRLILVNLCRLTVAGNWDGLF